MLRNHSLTNFLSVSILILVFLLNAYTGEPTKNLVGKVSAINGNTLDITRIQLEGPDTSKMATHCQKDHKKYRCG